MVETMRMNVDAGTATGMPLHACRGEKVRVDSRRRGRGGVLAGVPGRDDGLTVQGFGPHPQGTTPTRYRFEGVTGDHPVDLFMPAEPFEEVVGVVLREGDTDWFAPADGNGGIRLLSDEPGRRAYAAFSVPGATGMKGFLESPRFGRLFLFDGRDGWRLDAVVSQRAASPNEVAQAREAVQRYGSGRAMAP